MNRKWIIGKSIFLFFMACLIIVGVAFTIQSVRATVSKDQPRRFEARNGEFFFDNEPFLLVSGEMHFGRVLPEDWDDRLKQAKAMGLNTVSFYLF